MNSVARNIRGQRAPILAPAAVVTVWVGGGIPDTVQPAKTRHSNTQHYTALYSIAQRITVHNSTVWYGVRQNGPPESTRGESAHSKKSAGVV